MRDGGGQVNCAPPFAILSCGKPARFVVQLKP